MSLLGSLNTAIGGLTAQSKALGNISENVANSSTVGYKRVDTNFQALVTTANATAHEPGAVVARPDYINSVQGTIKQTENPLALAIGGQGFFSVAMSRGTEDGLPTFDDRQLFTRAGDFSMDKNGYLVNSSGYYLQGYVSDSTTGNPDRTKLEPIRVDQDVFKPVETSSVTLSANLPGLSSPAANGAAGTDAAKTTQIKVYDSIGTQHAINVTFTPTTTQNLWTMSFVSDDDQTATALGSVGVTFNTDGTIATITAADPNTVPTPSTGPSVAAGTSTTLAQVTLACNFGQNAQSVTLNLGTFNSSDGLTQYSSSDLSVRNLSQNGVPLGSYSGISISGGGDVSVNYDNGQSRVIYRVPLVTFSAPDSLQSMDGQAFLRTTESGEARLTDVQTNGAGKLVVGSVESSNVDIAAEFTKLIVAQRSYTANTKVVTTSDDMLQDTINMRR